MHQTASLLSLQRQLQMLWRLRSMAGWVDTLLLLVVLLVVLPPLAVLWIWLPATPTATMVVCSRVLRVPLAQLRA